MIRLLVFFGTRALPSDNFFTPPPSLISFAASFASRFESFLSEPPISDARLRWFLSNVYPEVVRCISPATAANSR